MTETTSNWKLTKRRFLNRVAAALGPFLFRSLAATWRKKRFGQEHLGARGAKDQHPIIATWHESIPAGTVLHRKRGFVALVSLHRDGQMIARIMERLGFRTVRGSSSTGGSKALREMLKVGREPVTLVITPDGPRGPAHSIAPGTLFMSASLGRPIIAFGFACSNMWRAGSWDRMVLPKPFSRIVVGFSEPMFVPRAALKNDELMAKCKAELAQKFKDAHQQAEALLAGQVGTQ